jgi:hypothetical protein
MTMTNKDNNRQVVYYQDNMDATRLVRPVKWEGKSVLCAIYYYDNNGEAIYHGQARVPSRLFDPGNSSNERYGYSPVHYY